MKPVAKKGLLIIGILYTATVTAMITDFVMHAEPRRPQQLKKEVRAGLEQARRAAHSIDPEHIRSAPITEKEAEELTELMVKKGSIINVNYTLLIQCMNFGILLLVLYGFLWDPLLSFLDERRKHVEGQLEDAAESKREARELVKQRQQELADLRAERADILEKAQNTAERQREDILERARREAERTAEETRERLREEYRRARTALREELGDLTARLAARVLQREVDQADHQRIIDDMVEQMSLESEQASSGREGE